MATDFKILRGNKDTLIDENGVVLIPESKLVNGYWYLTNDTAEVFVCLEFEGHKVLKKINECDSDWDELRIEGIEERITQLEEQGPDVLTLPSREAFPITGRSNVLYVNTADQKSYIWLDTDYVLVGGGDGYEEPDVIYGGSAN